MYYLIKTYGCQMNVHESEKIAGILKSKGYTATDDKFLADIIVFNTCCIREGAENRALGNIGAVKNLKKRKRDLIIAVCGCMTQKEGTSEDIISKFPYIDIILGTHNISSLGEKIDKLRQSPKHSIAEIVESSEDYKEIAGVAERSGGLNAWVNIMYGCDNYCTYCVVPYVRGRERSRPKDEVLDEIRQIAAEGKFREITLLGQNVNSYGNDIKGTSCQTQGFKSAFAGLLSEVAKIEGGFRVKFMTSHPKDLSEEVVKVIAENEKLAKFIHLPVQSGSTKVLSEMNRKYTRDDYLNRIDMIKSIIPDVGLSGDVMVGFPGESDSDFEDTLSLIKQVRYDNLYMFVYSRRSGTKADLMPDQVPEEVKTERIKKLVALQRQIGSARAKEQIGKIKKVLIENESDGLFSGSCDCGKIVQIVAGAGVSAGDFVRAEITGSKASKLIGKIV